MAETKTVSKIKRTAILKNRMDEERRKENYLIQAHEGLKTFDDLFAEIEECWDFSEAICFDEAGFIFYPKLLLLMSTGESEKIGVEALRNDISRIMAKKCVADKWDMEVLLESEVRKIYFEYSAENRNNNYHQILCLNDMNNAVGFIVHNSRFVPVKEVLETNRGSCVCGSFLSSFARVTNSVSTLRVPKGYRFDGKKKSKLQIILAIGGIPKTIESKGILKNLINLVEKGYVIVTNDAIKLTDEGISAVENGKCNQIGSVKLTKDYVNDTDDYGDTIDVTKMTPEEKATYLAYYADCDNIRANINLYDMAWLEDPNQGHWELWDGNEGEDLISLAPGNKIYARNPKCDIKSDCIVGIDFGTKSTVVVCQNESGMIRPMPIGNGDIRKQLEARDFENPTVMQFIDVDGFRSKYLERAGRPYTRWQDLIVSHAANESMKDTGVRSTEFYSYLYDLKQWAGEGKTRLNLRDKNGKDILLAAYNELISVDELINMDPIEIYAYYIGLYINNMNNGIYLNYLLSFPVTYEKNIRNAILKSFEKGLKKSLPESIINDSEIMGRFNVVAGASEPAAYAICALEEYGFEPEEDEKVFYGIFDFGGGTSDFDFGLWTKSKEEDLFDYCIEHFGTQGDRYLGGENLLQLLAFEVFAQNIQLCRNERIPFAKPIELVNIPMEITGFVNDSQEARMNQKLMMEKLRPFWERSDGQGELLVDINEFSEFQIGLFNVDGSLKSNLAFEIEVEKLNAILKQRIEKGVKQFFEALKDTFSSRHISKTARAEKINIFLAGNSSKSPILQEIFKRNIDEWNKGITSSRRGEEDTNHFVLFPALGTNEAKRVQKERGITPSNSLESPTGKTGVAWGLIEGREGGRIEVKEEVSFENEAKFAFYLGIQKGRNFFLKLRRDEEYSKWIKFLPARRKINEILYTSLPEAASGNLLCSETGVLRKRIEIAVVGDDKYIYIRFVSTNCIEYAVGDAEGNIDENTIKSENF